MLIRPIFSLLDGCSRHTSIPCHTPSREPLTQPAWRDWAAEGNHYSNYSRPISRQVSFTRQPHVDLGDDVERERDRGGGRDRENHWDREYDRREEDAREEEEDMKRKEEDVARNAEEAKKMEAIAQKETDAERKENLNEARIKEQDAKRKEEAARLEEARRKAKKLSRKEEEAKQREAQLEQDTEKTKQMQLETRKIAEALRKKEEEAHMKDIEMKERENILRWREEELMRREADKRKADEAAKRREEYLRREARLEDFRRNQKKKHLLNESQHLDDLFEVPDLDPSLVDLKLMEERIKVLERAEFRKREDIWSTREERKHTNDRVSNLNDSAWSKLSNPSYESYLSNLPRMSPARSRSPSQFNGPSIPARRAHPSTGGWVVVSADSAPANAWDPSINLKPSAAAASTTPSRFSASISTGKSTTGSVSPGTNPTSNSSHTASFSEAGRALRLGVSEIQRIFK